MRKLMTLAALCAAVPVLAQTPPPAPRFAFLSRDFVMGTSTRGKVVTADLVELQKALRERLRAKSEALQTLAQQMKSPGLTDEGRARLQRDLQDGEIAFKRAEEDAQKEFNAGLEKVEKTYQEEVAPIVTALAKEWNVLVVLKAQNNLIEYADDAWLASFSEEVVRRYDAKFAGSAQAKPATPAPAPAKPAKPVKK